MNCPKCGTENVENASHCMTCGAELRAQQPQQPQIQIQKFIKPAIIAVAGIIAVIIVISIFSSLFGSDKFVYVEDNMYYYYIDEEIHVMLNDEEIYKTEAYVDDETVAFDNKTAYFIEYDKAPETDEDEEKGGTLKLLNKKGATDVAENVLSIEHVSRDGKYVYYINADKEYCVFDGKEEVKIDIDTEKQTVVTTIISGNGKYFAYTTYDKDDLENLEKASDLDYDSFIYFKGEAKAIEEKGFIPMTITDNGKSLYGYKIDAENNTMTLWSLVKDEATKIGDFSNLGGINYDRTQILFYNDNKTYLSVDFGEKVKLGNNNWNVVTPDDAYINDFEEQFYTLEEDNEKKLYYFEKADKTTKIANNIYSVKLSADGENAYYIKNSALFLVEEGDFEEPLRVADDVESYVFTEDGKYVYFIDDDETAFAVKPGKDKEKIADDAYSLYISKDDNLYIKADVNNDNEGTLLHTKSDKKAEKVAEDVKRVYIVGENVFYSDDYSANSDGESTFKLNIRKSGAKFEKFAEDVTEFDY